MPKEADGTVDIVFHLDSRELDEKTVVVFEDLYHNGVNITSHADIKDKAQSITYPEKPEPVISIPQTGDTTNLLVYAGNRACIFLLLRLQWLQEFAERMQKIKMMILNS